jgi:misacylated tRNA(Ala) deacylase
MTEPLFVAEPYRKSATARVIAQTDEGGLILDRTIFYARGGGQPGDSGTLDWEGARIAIATTIKGDEGAIILVPAEPCILPPVGAETEHRLDWHLRYGHMRIHTALHLLSVVLPYPVTGGAIGHDKGRLDFDMPDSPDDPAVIEGRLNAFVTRDLPVSADWSRPCRCSPRAGQGVFG